MAMHDNIKLPRDGSKVDLYAETGVVRGSEIRWMNIGGSTIYDYSDNVALPDGETNKHKKRHVGEEGTASGDQFVQVWSDNGGLISVESV